LIELKTEYEGPISRAEKWHVISVSGWRYQRPVTKIAKCHHCGLCYLYCPVNCVVDMGHYFERNLDYCKGCGICARECPNDAIAMVIEEGGHDEKG